MNQKNKSDIIHMFTVDPETGIVTKDYWRCIVCGKLKIEKDVTLYYKYDNRILNLVVEKAMCNQCKNKMPKNDQIPDNVKELLEEIEKNTTLQESVK